MTGAGRVVSEDRMYVPTSGSDDIERKIGMVLLAILAIGCLIVLRPFLTAILWAAIFSSSTWPIYARLERLFHGRRSTAAAVMVALTSALFLLPLTVLASRLATEVAQATVLISGWMEVGPPEPPPWVATIPLIGARLDAYWQDVAYDGAKLAADMRAYIGPAREWILSTGMTLAASLTQLVLALVISFFFYRDGIAGAQSLRSALGRIGGPRAERLLAIAGATINGVVYGVLGTNFIQATLAAIGLKIVGVPSPYFLGFLLFFLTMIPLAPAIVFVPAILWLAHQGAVGSVAFLAVWYVIVFMIIDGALRPYLISRGSELPLLLVFLGMIGGVATFGLLGIFLGPTLLAAGYALQREWNAAEQDLTFEMPPPDKAPQSLGIP